MHVDRIHLLVPFALPPAAASAALPDLTAPALERLTARAALTEQNTGEDFQRTLPHERWLTRQFSASNSSIPATNDDTPLAPYMLLADGGHPGDVPWACVQPVHLQVAHNYLMLVDPASLALSDAEAEALYAVAKPLIEEHGARVEAPTPHRWYLSGEALSTLAGAAPLRASGRNIEIWLPHETHSGTRSRAWIKLQNEIQMAWFEHPVNQARETRGLPAVNSVWFHAQGTARPVTSPFAHVLSNAVATRGLGLAARVATHPAPARLAGLTDILNNAARDAVLVELDALCSPFIEQDWPRWNNILTTLERDWFAPALAALQSGALRELDLTLCGDTSSVTLNLTRGDLRRFWRRRPLKSLFTE